MSPCSAAFTLDRPSFASDGSPDGNHTQTSRTTKKMTVLANNFHQDLPRSCFLGRIDLWTAPRPSRPHMLTFDHTKAPSRRTAGVAERRPGEMFAEPVTLQSRPARCSRPRRRTWRVHEPPALERATALARGQLLRQLAWHVVVCVVDLYHYL